jgi:hypothetical protein
MPEDVTTTDRTLKWIIIGGFSLAFGFLLASLQALRSTPSGFLIEITWVTWLTFLLGAAAVTPCFQTILSSESKPRRRVALGIIIAIGLVSFLYPLRFVPRERLGAILTGLLAAAFALSCVAGCLLLARRYFERDDQEGP